jgi:signal transduction histidine kinase
MPPQPAPLPWPTESDGPTPAALPEAHAPANSPAQVQKRHRAKDERRRSFLRMVSHELRTPLNTVIGFSEIIACELYGPLGAPQYKEYAELVRQSGHRLLKLVNQVIEIARLEDGVVEMDQRPESLEHAIEDVLNSMRDEIAAKSLTVEISPDPPTVLADGRGLRTVLMNLLQNAILHSPPGGILNIRCRKLAATVEFDIEDHGPGADPAHLPRLLKPFEQGADALTRSAEGAGLGLPITQLLIKVMGGQLRLRSALGDGFTATVSLPAA